MERKVFELPEHPTRGAQRIVVELPAPDSVWYLVLEKDKAIPLPGLKVDMKITAADVMDAAAKQQGDGWMIQFVGNGYSKAGAV
jgi:hypothetical protein